MKRRLALAAIALASLGAGCSLWPATTPAEAPTLHLLDARPVVVTPPRRDLVLAVSPLRAAPGADSAAMLYLRQPNVLEPYATHRWADTPARLMAPLLLRALDDAGGFRAVVTTASAVPAALRLDTEIVRLRQSFLTRPSRVELTLRAQLLDVPLRRVLATRYIDLTQETASDDAPGGASAANVALAQALAQLAQFCAEASDEARTSGTAAPSGR